MAHDHMYLYRFDANEIKIEANCVVSLCVVSLPIVLHTYSKTFLLFCLDRAKFSSIPMVVVRTICNTRETRALHLDRLWLSSGGLSITTDSSAVHLLLFLSSFESFDIFRISSSQCDVDERE